MCTRRIMLLLAVSVTATDCKIKPVSPLNSVWSEFQGSRGDPRPTSFSSVSDLKCHELEKRGNTARAQCRVNGKSIDVLIQRGTAQENARDQGFLQANDIDTSPLDEIETQVGASLAALPEPTKQVAYRLLDCLAIHIKRSVTPEFAQAVDGIISGYDAGHPGPPKYGKEALLRSVVGIELGSMLYKFQHAAESGTPAQIGVAMSELRSLCPNVLNEAEPTIESLLKSGIASHLPTRAGCSGLVVAGAKSKDGTLVHGRNLDGDVTESWSEHPSLHLIAEPGFIKFFAIGTAGLFYPGGVSGLNERGISVSIHQMYAAHPRVQVSGNKAAIGPWVLQNILRSATSISDAIAVAQSFEHLATWTILVADGKTGESASIEIAPGKVVVSRRVQNTHLPQSNHMFSPSMLDEAFFPYLNKRLETLSRATVLDRLSVEAADQSIDAEWMMGTLSSHVDAWEGTRAFGRTVAKVYTMMSSVAIPWPEGGGRPQLWFTIGDKFPRTHSTYVGFAVDFAQEKVFPLSAKQAVWSQGKWEHSLNEFTKGHLANREGRADVAIEAVRGAIALAAEDGVREPAYDYILARLLQKSGQNGSALEIFRDLDRNAEALGVHPYQRVLVRLNALSTSDRVPGAVIDAATRRTWIAESRVVLNNLREPGIDTNIEYLLNLFTMLRARIPIADAAVDFMIVE